jgi:hypothetical protein
MSDPRFYRPLTQQNLIFENGQATSDHAGILIVNFVALTANVSESVIALRYDLGYGLTAIAAILHVAQYIRLQGEESPTPGGVAQCFS